MGLAMKNAPLNLDLCLAKHRNWIEEAHLFQTIDSTNNYVKTSCSGVHSCLVLAESQHAGRGRYTRRFYSPPGVGIYLSLRLSETKLVAWELLVPLALVVSLERLYGLRARIKWPNDVHIQGKKVAGVLIERSIDASGQTLSVLGVGVNVHSHPFPPELKDTAASLESFSAAPLDRNHIIEAFLSELRTLKDDPNALQRYRSYAYPTGQRVRVQFDGGWQSGKILEVSAEGHLWVVLNEGQRLRLVDQTIELELNPNDA
jgi:BirA family biotin operon repressor/biotin-[acetyl-CoA-carboxylase] ligase